MSLTRKDRLQALGLWPIWQLRASKPVKTEPESPTQDTPIIPTEPGGARLSLVARLTSLTTPALSPEPTPEPIPEQAAIEVPHLLPDMDGPTLEAAIKSCRRCILSQTRTQAVPGAGDLHAEWLFIGDAPGTQEDCQGEPFAGDAGKLLNAMLLALGLTPGHNAYITNLIKSRPPGNRDPLPAELAACLPYLDRQIELIQPKIMVVLGRFAAQNLLKTDTPIGTLRGQVHRYHGVPLVVTYHPTYLLHNPLDKAKAWKDLLLARDTLNASKNVEDIEK